MYLYQKTARKLTGTFSFLSSNFVDIDNCYTDPTAKHATKKLLLETINRSTGNCTKVLFFSNFE